MSRGLYIHFPFCEKKCNYCDFYSTAASAKRADYIDALCRELAQYKGINIDTVYFGGGTPSLMTVDELKKVSDTVSDTFSVDSKAEITLEANPMSASDEGKLADFKALGINRLSIGVQSFSNRELAALGRGHSAEEAIATVKAAQRFFDNISLDLMLAIPHQTVESFRENLDTAISLGVSHISVYALSIEEKTVFGVKQRRGENLFLPNEDDEAVMYASACEKLGAAGYEHYEISNFALTSYRSRHNMKYWLGEEYIGVGASAHSYFNGVRYSYPSDISELCKGAKRLDCYTNTPTDRAEEFVFLSLRLKDGLDLEALEKLHGIKPTEKFFKTIKKLTEQGLAVCTENKAGLTEKGFFVSNSIIVDILDSLDM